jgi:hypothetical protein
VRGVCEPVTGDAASPVSGFDWMFHVTCYQVLVVLAAGECLPDCCGDVLVADAVEVQMLVHDGRSLQRRRASRCGHGTR